MQENYYTITHPDGSRLAYRNSSALASRDAAPVVLFLGGFYSNMDGSKAEYLHSFCETNNIAFLRFDYRGHGQSSGEFIQHGISDWIDDAVLVASLAGDRPLVLVGSSMGGWIAARIIQRKLLRIAGYVGIAAAPDFTEEGFWARFDERQRTDINSGGIVEMPSGYELPYPIGKVLIEQGRAERVFPHELKIDAAVHLFYGLDDQAVTYSTTERFFRHIQSDELSLEMRMHADHGFSRPSDLHRLSEVIRAMVAFD